MKRFLLTPGEGAGIGPDITIKLAQHAWPAELIAIADPEILLARARLLNESLRLIETDLNNHRAPHLPGTLKILPLKSAEQVQPGHLNPKNAEYVLQTLSVAAHACLNQQADALITGPVHKGILNQAGIAFSGHTEFFAHLAKVPLTVMLFVLDNLKIALVTTHLPLAAVSAAITPARLTGIIKLLNEALIRQFKITDPRILICGLNPHAGENGYLGREEIEIITPVINQLKQHCLNLTGPLPADTIFTPSYLRQADAILAMYHDQALPLVKYLGFGRAVNITLGLPFIRTSVDHGTALDLAATGKADAGSLIQATQLALDLLS